MHVTFTRAGMRRGAWRGVPLLLGLAPFGLVVGVIAEGRGLSLAESFAMSAIVFAGASQLLALELWTSPPDILAVSLAALAVNLRMIPFGPGLAFWLDHLRGWRLWGSLFLMVDHCYPLSVIEHRSGGRDAGFLFGLGLFSYAGWLVATTAGHLLAGMVALPGDHWLFFAAPASFLALLVPLWRGARLDLAPWGLAAGVALGAQGLGLPAPAPLLGGALSGALLAVWAEGRTRDGAGTGGARA